MKIYERFWDRIARKYSNQPVADEAAYQEKLRKTREYLTPDSEVFEFGCGTGSTAVSHAPYVRKILAIDVSPKMIDIAREKARMHGVRNVTFEVASIDEFDDSGARFDVVMAHSILHLLKDPNRAIRQAHAMLKPGGVFVSSTFCMGDHLVTKAIRAGVTLFSWVGLLPYVNKVSSEQLVESIRRAGFSIEHEWRPKPKSALFLIARKT